ncbi:FadR/GntR family transcriptional regulator [Streptomyces sp. NPDC050560]|uniref:FadR/GntR family transcriptional regulator n=1 Tax=Streptomyces sp. NPDC050560 TaxID=3365630 RepID=UPI0037AF13CD
MPRTPWRPASLSAELVNSLRSHIEAGWPVGTRIPPEPVLIKELGVGRSTLREAIGALVPLGLLEPRAGDGSYVRSASELQSVMVRRASSAQRDKVPELRTVLEEYASGAATLRRGDGRLRELLSEADASYAAEDVAAAASVDALFHRAVVLASGNDLLMEVYDHLGTALTSSLGGLPWDATRAEEHAGLHRRLVDAIAARDAAAALVRLTGEHEAGTARGTEDE